jgi:type IV fimbrial biogenesis protein FimT
MAKGRTRGPAGFTLIELMIVIALVAIMIAVAVPSIMAITNRGGAQYAADELYGILIEAKTRAIRFNTDCSVTFDTANNRYTRLCLDEAARGEAGETVELSKYRGTVQFIAAPGVNTAATNIITYSPRGFAPAGSNGPVYIREADNDIVYRVRTLIAGATDVHRYDATNDTWK